MTTDSPLSPPPIVVRPKRSKRSIALIVVAAIALVAVVYWFMHRHELSTDDAAIEAQIVALAPKVGGYVTALHVTDNQHVAAGEVIAEIDPRDYEIALQKAKAGLASAEARLAGAGHSYASTRVSAPLSITSAQAQVDASAADWQRAKQELARMQRMGDAARSRQQLETAIALEKSAHSSFEDANARLKSAAVAPNTVATAAASVKDIEAAVAMQQAAVTQAEKDLADTKIIAPIAGKISHRTIELGSYLQPGQQILSLVSDDYWVVANFKETQLAAMKPGQQATIRIDAYPQREYKAHLDSIQLGTGARFSIFPPENATGNFVKIVQRVPVKLVFDEKPEATLAIGPGMSVVPVIFVR